MTTTLYQSTITSLPLLARGKVRDNYAVGSDRILMVATDRLSAFDVVMSEPIPGKGEVLTKMALFWFDLLKDIVPNHLTGEDPTSVVRPDERDQVRGRSMLVKRLKPLPIEAVVRGYLAGSGWKEYQQSQSVCGVPLPPGLKNASRLPQPIFTPATKAEAGEHDENISFERACEIVGRDLAEQVRDVSLRLYTRAAEYALGKGIIIADTKFEFGLDDAGTLTLMDEVLTPDSSRFWPVEGYAEGTSPPSYDKQGVRDWLEAVRIEGKPWDKKAPAPRLPPELAARVAERYKSVYAALVSTTAVTARMIRRLDEQISTHQGSTIAGRAMAKKALHLVRLGHKHQANEILEALHRKYDPEPQPSISAWIHLVEGLASIFLGTPGRPDDKLKRSLAIATAVGDDEVGALAAAWSAHLAYGVYDLEAFRLHLKNAFAMAAPENHQALARAKLIAAVALHLSNRYDLARRLYSEVRAHAASEGDDATVSALMHNLACMCVANMRQRTLDPGAPQSAYWSPTGPNALTGADATANYDDLIGASSLSTWVPILQAQAHALQGDTARALEIYEDIIADANDQGLQRVLGYMKADMAWCRLRTRGMTSVDEVQAAEDSLGNPGVLVDDRAATRCRLAAIYRELGSPEKAARQEAIATAEWAQFRALQEGFVAVVSPLVDESDALRGQ